MPRKKKEVSEETFELEEGLEEVLEEVPEEMKENRLPKKNKRSFMKILQTSTNIE